jgi:hypothetical protein
VSKWLGERNGEGQRKTHLYNGYNLRGDISLIYPNSLSVPVLETTVCGYTDGLCWKKSLATTHLISQCAFLKQFSERLSPADRTNMK